MVYTLFWQANVNDFISHLVVFESDSVLKYIFYRNPGFNLIYITVITSNNTGISYKEVKHHMCIFKYTHHFVEKLFFCIMSS